MNWEAIGVITEVIGTLAVIVTLVYLSRQVKEGNKQAELEGLRHTLDGFNEYCDLIVSSKETARLLNRGRQDLKVLDEDEMLQFEHIHIRFLNTMEGWARSVQETARDEQYRQIQKQNMEAAVYGWFFYPGSRAVWEKFRDAFPLLVSFFDEALESLDSESAEKASP